MRNDEKMSMTTRTFTRHSHSSISVFVCCPVLASEGRLGMADDEHEHRVLKVEVWSYQSPR